MKWNVSPSQEEMALLMEAGLIYREMKQFDQAREVFCGVRALLPASELPEIALGTVSLHEGDFDTAVRYYEQAIEKNPRSAYAYAHLGEAQIFRLQKEAAYECLHKALELDRRGPAGKLARSLLDLAECVRFV